MIRKRIEMTFRDNAGGTHTVSVESDLTHPGISGLLERLARLVGRETELRSGCKLVHGREIEVPS